MFKSPQFWTAIADAVISLILYFAAKYLAPEYVEDVKVLILALQPIVGMVIAGLFVQDVKRSIMLLR